MTIGCQPGGKSARNSTGFRAMGLTTNVCNSKNKCEPSSLMVRWKLALVTISWTIDTKNMLYLSSWRENLAWTHKSWLPVSNKTKLYPPFRSTVDLGYYFEVTAWPSWTISNPQLWLVAQKKLVWISSLIEDQQKPFDWFQTTARLFECFMIHPRMNYTGEKRNGVFRIVTSWAGKKKSTKSMHPALSTDVIALPHNRTDTWALRRSNSNSWTARSSESTVDRGRDAVDKPVRSATTCGGRTTHRQRSTPGVSTDCPCPWRPTRA